MNDVSTYTNQWTCNTSNLKVANKSVRPFLFTISNNSWYQINKFSIKGRWVLFTNITTIFFISRFNSTNIWVRIALILLFFEHCVVARSILWEIRTVETKQVADVVDGAPNQQTRFKGWLESLIDLTTNIIDRNLILISQLWYIIHHRRRNSIVSLNVWLERSKVDQELSYQTPAEGAQ